MASSLDPSLLGESPLAAPSSFGARAPLADEKTPPTGDDGSVFVVRTRRNDGEEGVHAWGFADTAFGLHADGSVVLSGARYGLCGLRLQRLLPWVEKTMQLRVRRTPNEGRCHTPALPPSALTPAFVRAVQHALGPHAFDASDAARVRCGHGHTQEEMYALRHGELGRMPDGVIRPDCERDVVALVALAQEHGVCLVPFGGGTNVTEALRCPAQEPRPIASVDMRGLDRILWIDEANGLACIEAGAVGRHIAAALDKRGFCLGHEPDSIEFSTLGGWIATHASGMKKNKYGNIEDLVQDVSVASSFGLLQSRRKGPRQSVGVDVERCLFGSEGTLGIVTSAVVKIFARPEATEYGSAIFPSFEDGVALMYALARQNVAPASARLVDNTQFQLGMALKEDQSGLLELRSRAQKFFVTRVKGFDPSRMVALTLVFEGSRAQIERQRAQVYALCKAHKGLPSGQENGRQGYALTYSIAYIRDFVLKHGILAESFETSLPWTHVLPLCERVKARIEREHRAEQLPGKPLVTCRVTQLYDAGAAVYFYFATGIDGVARPSEAYARIERAAREEVLAAGGSLSHHHGVGKLRQSFLPSVFDAASLAWRRQLKAALDPHNVFGVANGPQS